LLRIHIIFVVVLVSWLALGVIVVGLLNVAKMLVRSSARRHHAAASTRGQVLAIDGREGAGQAFRTPPHRHPGAVALPPPQASRRSA
jgi:hypothetical protein